MTFKNNDRVRYVGDQKQLKDLVGTVKRDTVAANGNILVQFDDRPPNKPTVVNPKNLRLLTTATPTNPKDAAVVAYGKARDNRSSANSSYADAKKTLAAYGLISDEERTPGYAVAYESNAVRLDACTSQPGEHITVESLLAALETHIPHRYLRTAVLKAAVVPKKAATTYKVIVK